MSKRISRSTFIKGLAAAGASAVAGKLLYDRYRLKDRIPCRMLGPSLERGHGLWAPDLRAATDAELVRVAIVGAGIAGLSAGWWLKKKGFTDFKIFELEDEVGGNSRSGKNSVTAYPWGAHYVPLANDESEYVREFFEEVGIITGTDKSGLPIYNELFLCHEPQERLFKDGGFQEGLVPKKGLQAADSDQIARFFTELNRLREARGKDGKKAFAIPLDLSSQDKEFLDLDKISMKDWMESQSFNSRPLLWYVNYCCRDDYGVGLSEVSAWAGLHYFAGRRGRAANAENNTLVTWPEGNGFLVSKLQDVLAEHIVPAAVLYKAKEKDARVTLSIFDKSANPRAYSAEYVIFSAPRFVAKHVLDDFEMHSALPAYAPWMVANVTVSKVPPSRGEELAWDNVSYYSQSLGYVDATHQNISTRQGATVLTYYFPLSSDPTEISRMKLLKANVSDWKKVILDDLEKMHPGISSNIQSIDMWRWGHGMVSPRVGFLWGADRKAMTNALGRIHFAHSDMSGISNFEEAQYQGVEAAKRVLVGLKV